MGEPFAGLRRRVQRLEQQRQSDPRARFRAMTPEARQQRMHELLLKCGVAEDEVETVQAALRAMVSATS